MNPFQQSSVTYCLELQTQFQYLQFFVQFCETLSDSIVYFEAEDTKTIDSKPEDLWQINIYLDQRPNLDDLSKQFDELAKQLQVVSPKLTLAKVDDHDWVTEVQKTFVPIDAGKFFIHHSDYDGYIPSELIKIEINAGRAFGTGEHETTSNCLRALSEFIKSGIGLDVGCGSGILSIAMSKLGMEKVIAVDLDHQAVSVTEENFLLNKVNNITASQADGYNSKIIIDNAPYQVITANILANPLIEMAEDAARNLSEDGILILAGFLKEQAAQVLEAHKKYGLKLIKEICFENWPVLVVSKV